MSAAGPSRTDAGRSRIRAVLFDMDGVLVDSLSAHLHSWNVSFEAGRLASMDLQTYLTLTGKTNREMLKAYAGLHHYDLSPSASQEIIDRKEKTLRSIARSGMRTTPGVVTWLEYCRSMQIHCAVASSGEMANIVTFLEALELGRYFTSILSGTFLPASKPDPQIFLLAAASLDAAPGECLVIEDAPLGVRAAKAAGMLCCALATTVRPHELEGADFVLENLSELHPAAVLGDGSTHPGGG